MRKIMTTMGLGVALTLGAAGMAAAQAPRHDTHRPDSAQPRRGDRDARAERGTRRRGGPERALLRGITLNADQQARVEQLRRDQASEMKQAREQFAPLMKEAREARQRGDTAAARAKMEQARAQMTRQREQHVAALRGILTAEQQKQFEANVTAWKERATRNGVRGERGARGGRHHGGGQPRGDRNGTGR